MTRILIICALAATTAACAPVAVEQPATAAFPDFIAAEPVIVVAAPVPVPAPQPAAARPSGPVGPLPQAPEGAGEGLPPTGSAACGGVGIEAGC